MCMKDFLNPNNSKVPKTPKTVFLKDECWYRETPRSY